MTRARLFRACPWLVFVAVLAVELAAYWPLAGALSGGHDIDEAVYYNAAQAWLTGHRPYVDFVYTQPPLSLVLFMPASLVGLLTQRQDLGFLAARMTSSVALAATIAMLWQFFRQRYASPWAGLVAALLLAGDAITNMVGHYVMIEPVLGLLTLAVLVLALDGRLLIAAGLAALAVLTKSQGIVACVPLLAIGCLRRDWLGLAKAAGLGLGAVALVLAAGQWLSSGELVQQAVLFQFNRPSEHSLSDQAGIVGWLLQPATRVLAVAGLLGLLRLRKAWSLDGLATASVVCWLAASVLLVSRSYSYYYHYWAQIALPLALVAGFLVLGPAGALLRCMRIAGAGILAGSLATGQVASRGYRLQDNDVPLIQAHAGEMRSAGFDPVGWANIVLSRPLPAAGSKLAIDAYATEQYLEIRPFNMAHVWAAYSWDGMVGQILRSSDWVWTDPRGERVLLPRSRALRAALFEADFRDGPYVLYDRSLASAKGRLFGQPPSPA